MIRHVVQLAGGLGNQMFQYAFGQSLGDDTVYDAFRYGESRSAAMRDYWLDRFVCEPRLLDQKWVKRRGEKGLKLVRSPLDWLKPRIPLVIERHALVFEPGLMKQAAGYYEGYFQCPRYFAKLRSALLRAFVPRASPGPAFERLRNEIRTCEAVAVHIRRGDYLTAADYYGLCGLDYYHRAMGEMMRLCAHPKFYIFSDDLAWARANLKVSADHVFVELPERTNPLCDMMLMRDCHHNIIANSSYSWWGAWLNENPDKTVICPKSWLADGKEYDIYEKGWLRL